MRPHARVGHQPVVSEIVVQGHELRLACIDNADRTDCERFGARGAELPVHHLEPVNGYVRMVGCEDVYMILRAVRRQED